MVSPRERREQLRGTSTVRRMAEANAGGFTTTTLKLPDGMGFFAPKEGRHEIAILPYIPKISPDDYVVVGKPYWERTYYRYNRIGAEEKNYVCLSKTFKKPDPIQDHLREIARRGDADQAFIKSLEPKKRQLFLIYDLKDTEKGIQLWETSFHTFGKHLLDRIQASPEEKGWDLFYYPGCGLNLEIYLKEVSRGGYKFLDTVSIDFNEREKALPEDIENHKHCLDDFLVEYSYDALKRIFLALPPEETEQKEGKQEEAQQEKTTGRTSSSPADEGPKFTEAELREQGKAAFKAGKKRDANPWKLSSMQGTAWQEGWLDALETSQNDSDSGNDKTSVPTAQSLGIERGAIVEYQGKPHTVVRVSDDGLLLKLMDPQDDLVPNVAVTDVELASTSSTEEATKREKKKEEKKQTKKEPDGEKDDVWDDY